MANAVSFGVTMTIAMAASVGNLYIILCLMLSQDKDRKKKETHDIFMTISISSFFHILSSIMSATWSFLLTDMVPFNMTLFKILGYFLSCTIFSGIFLTSFLFFLYWGKIVVLGRLLRLKKHLSQAVPWLMVTFLLTCFTMSSFTFQLDIQYQNTSEGILKDALITSMNKEGVIFASILVALVVLLPFCLMVLACISLLVHLSRHVQQLHSDTCEIPSPQVHREKRIMKMLFIQLLLFTSYIFILVIILILENTDLVSGIQVLFPVVPVLYSLCTSINLIRRNGYLRKTSQMLLSKLKGQG